LVDSKGRRIMWAWIFEGRQPTTPAAEAWSGTMSLPRVLWLSPDRELRMAPPDELVLLRHNPKKVENVMVPADSECLLSDICGNDLELRIELVAETAAQFGASVCCSADGVEQTRVYYDVAESQLKVDTTRSSLREGPKSIESAPFALQPGEPLRLRIFIDRSVVEVFANDRQAIMRRIYPTRPDSQGVALFAHGGDALASSVEAWDMAPANPW